MKIFKKILMIFICSISIVTTSCSKGSDIIVPSYEDSLITDFDSLNEEHVKYLGRHVKSKIDDKELMLFSFSATGFDLVVETKSEINSISASFYSYWDGYQNGQYIKTFIDGIENETIRLEKNNEITINLFTNLTIGKHYLRVLKLNEASTTKMGLYSISSENIDFYKRKYNERRKVIEFYGDSITAGYGNLGDSSSTSYDTKEQDASKTYAYLASEELDCDSSLICWSGTALSQKLAPYGACIMDTYDTYEGSIKYDMSNDFIDIAVINLGTNDTSGYESLETKEEKEEGINEFKENFMKTCDTLLANNPNAKVIALYNCLSPFASKLITAIKELIKEINTKYKEDTAYSIKCIGNSSGANYHPNTIGHEIFADSLINLIKENNLI